MDEKLTIELRHWLDTPEEERDIEQGAELLLRLSRNRHLYQTILMRPERHAKKLDYELRKHLRIRLAGLTIRDVVRMEQDVVPAVEASLEAGEPAAETGEPAIPTDAEQPEAVHRGRRADHDSLPEEIRAIYDRGGEIYFKMKQLYETLRGMESAAACDRYELLVLLRELDDAYRKGWAAYDAYDPSAAAPEPASEAPATDEGDAGTQARAVQAARKYLSDGLRRLLSLTDETAREKLREEMRSRVELILSSGGSFKPDFLARLAEAGLEAVSVPGDEPQET